MLRTTITLLITFIFGAINFARAGIINDIGRLQIQHGGQVGLLEVIDMVVGITVLDGFNDAAELGHEFDINGNEQTTGKSRSRRQIIPGTKWCGPGDRAKSYGDLGYFYRLDSCCRAHDFCSDYIPSKEWKYGYYNWWDTTLLHCDCDRQFRTCLKNLDSFGVYFVGKTYFNWSGRQCFYLHYYKYSYGYALILRDLKSYMPY